MADIDWDLLLRYLGDECTPDERHTVERWLASDPRNSVILQDATAGAKFVMREEGITEKSAGAPARIRLLPSHAPSSNPRTQPIRAWAFAATLVLALFATPFARRFVYTSTSASIATHEFTTRPGERATFRFPDGTRVVLGPASALRYADEVQGRPREVTLTGEAFFDIVHDANRPLAVNARNTVTRDVGTQFVVRAYDTESQVRVVVAEGAADVAPTGRLPAATTRLSANMLLLVDANGTTHVTSGTDAAVYTSWTHGELVFEDAPLRDVAREISRWYGVSVAVPDSELALRRVTVRVTDPSPDAALSLIAAAVGARVAGQGGALALTLKSSPR